VGREKSLAHGITGKAGLDAPATFKDSMTGLSFCRRRHHEDHDDEHQRPGQLAQNFPGYVTHLRSSEKRETRGVRNRVGQILTVNERRAEDRGILCKPPRQSKRPNAVLGTSF